MQGGFGTTCRIISAKGPIAILIGPLSALPSAKIYITYIVGFSTHGGVAVNSSDFPPLLISTVSLPTICVWPRKVDSEIMRFFGHIHKNLRS